MPRTAEQNQCVTDVIATHNIWLGARETTTDGMYIGEDCLGVVSTDGLWADEQPDLPSVGDVIVMSPPDSIYYTGWHDNSPSESWSPLCQLRRD